MNLARNIRKAGRAKIAQKADFATGTGFSNSNEIKPAIVIVIDRGKSPSPLPSQIGQRDAFQTLAFHIAPQADPGRARVWEREIHPSILVEIERENAYGWRHTLF